MATVLNNQQENDRNDRILSGIRKIQEICYCRKVLMHGASGRLNFNLREPIPSLFMRDRPGNLDHVQGSANRWIALYFEPAREWSSVCQERWGYSPWHVLGYIFRKWWKGHLTPLDFERFPVKCIGLQGLSGDRDEDHCAILQFHESLRRQLELALEESYRATKSDLRFLSPVVNTIQARQYRLMGLFRALIMIVDGVYHDIESQLVHVLRTGDESRLSQPIDLRELDSSLDEYETEVTTTLSKAMDFLWKLGLREEQAFPFDETVIDESLLRFGHPPCYEGTHIRTTYEWAKSKGWTGGR